MPPRSSERSAQPHARGRRARRQRRSDGPRLGSARLASHRRHPPARHLPGQRAELHRHRADHRHARRIRQARRNANAPRARSTHGARQGRRRHGLGRLLLPARSPRLLGREIRRQAPRRRDALRAPRAPARVLLLADAARRRDRGHGHRERGVFRAHHDDPAGSREHGRRGPLARERARLRARRLRLRGRLGPGPPRHRPRVRAGGVAVNDFAVFYAIQLPFGGVAGSGYGRFAGDEGLRGLCNVKSVCEDRFGALGIRTAIPAPARYPVADQERDGALRGALWVLAMRLRCAIRSGLCLIF